MLYNNCTFKELQALEVDELNYYITTGLFIPPNSWGIPDIIEWNYGKVMELVMMFGTEINLPDVVSICCFATGKKQTLIENKRWHEVFAFYNHIAKEVVRVEEILKTLHVLPTQEEEAAGIDNFAQFGVFATIDRLAGGNVLKYEAIENMPFMVIYTKLKLNKVEAEYQEAYQKIITAKYNRY